MLKKENDIESYQLFLQLKNAIGFYRSQQFMDWFHNKYPDKDPHHIFGSIGNLKTTDLCSVPLSRIQHETIGNESQWAIDNLDLLLKTMIEYTKFLEEQCQLINK